jgi:hypothetical protein
MAAFASYRRSGWVRFLVLILCALFIFATLGAPPAQALGVESVAVFGLASVLSAATAALGFKLSSNEQGQATLQKMVQDFKTVAWATGFVLVGSKLNGLQNGMDYIKMQVQNGKTYLDSRVFAWVQQWLAQNGVYDAGGVSNPSYEVGSSLNSCQSYNDTLSVLSASVPSGFGYDATYFERLIENYSLKWYDDKIYQLGYEYTSGAGGLYIYNFYESGLNFSALKYGENSGNSVLLYGGSDSFRLTVYQLVLYSDGTIKYNRAGGLYKLFSKPYINQNDTYLKVEYSNGGTVVVNNSNDTGLSGTDTLGKDVVDLTLDQILEKLKEWAQDWYDAGADSATNAAAGAKDLPLTVATGAATANPSIAEDGPLVWFPPFSIPIPNLRTGETDTKTVDQGKENASAVETSTDVAENQSVIDSLVNWALSYISPDTGLFSKFPLCVPYDAYLLVTSSLGVDAVGSDSIFGASPGDLEGVVSQDIETYSDFQPIINIKHDFELDGKTYPVELTIDLTPWQPLVIFFREGMALLLVAELIGSEFKRIRGH